MTTQDAVISPSAPVPLDLIPAPRTSGLEVAQADAARREPPLRVLAVGINFGPEHAGIAPYTTQLCDFLISRGATVSVLTGVPHYPFWTVDPEYRWHFRRVERRDGLEVRRLRHYVPKTQSAARRGLYELTFAVQVALQRPHERPDVVLAVVPSLLSAVTAQRIAARVGVPLVVWVQDLMGPAAAQSGIDGGARVARLVGGIERWLLNRADQVLVLNAHFDSYVQSIGVDASRTTVQPNWTHMAAPSGADRERTRARLGWRAHETIVLHTGNMGLKQGLDNVVAAARLADERNNTSIRFVLMGDGSQRGTLMAGAEGVSAIDFLPPAPIAEYADILAAADILLVNERPSSVDMSLPSKLTSYFRAGRPVIAASAASGGTAAEIQRSGGGITVAPGEPKQLLDAVGLLAADPEHAEQLGCAGATFADQFLGAECALERLLATMRGLIERPGVRPMSRDAARGFRRSTQSARSSGPRIARRTRA